MIRRRFIVKWVIFISTLIIFVFSCLLFYFNDYSAVSSSKEGLQVKLGLKVDRYIQPLWKNMIMLPEIDKRKPDVYIKTRSGSEKFKANTGHQDLSENGSRQHRPSINIQGDTVSHVDVGDEEKEDTIGKEYIENMASDYSNSIERNEKYANENENEMTQEREEMGTHPRQHSADGVPKANIPPPHVNSPDQIQERKNGYKYLLASPCSDVLCTGYLSQRDIVNFTSCKRRAEAVYLKKLNQQSVSYVSNFAKRMENGHLLPSGECRFMNGSGRSPVGLVSFPGSGNTWVRGLLQKATGICTGAVYCDRMLRMGGFDGEGVQSGSVLVVKSHSSIPLWSKVIGRSEHGPKGRPFFDSIVLIVRNPFNALISEWNRELSTKYGLGKGNGTSHTNTYGQQYFLTHPPWMAFVERQIERWNNHFDWLFKCPRNHDIMLVRYEDLKSQLVDEMERILKFLHVPYDYEDLSSKLGSDFSIFHRTSKASFDHFTNKQKVLVNTVVESVSKRLHDTFGTSYNIAEYVSE